MRRPLLIAAAVAATLVLAAPPVGAGAPMSPLVVDPSEVEPGDTFSVSNPVGETCNATVSVTVPELLLGDTTTPDGDGNWSIEFTVPDDAEPGTYAVNATCLITVAPPWDYLPGELTVVEPVEPIEPTTIPLEPLETTTTVAAIETVTATPRFTG